jgi:glycosyltransferase involved in cell wall biosynthesis
VAASLHRIDGSRTPAPPQRILIVTEDVLTRRMAGPAIRAWQFADALAGAGHDVVLATTSSTCERSSDRFAAEACNVVRLGELEAWCSVVIVQGFVLERVPVLRATDKVLVVDMYDPLHFEALQLNASRPEPDRSVNVAATVRVLGEQLHRGDFFVCASEKQRDLWMGFLSAAGRVNPSNCDADPSLRRLIDVVAFGLPDRPPEHDRAALKGVYPGIGQNDEVVLWGGGVYDWLDPLTAIRAVDIVRRTRPSVRLFFLGVRHPNPVVEESPRLAEARILAGELGVEGTHVFFNDDWVAYEDRHNYLLEADVGISLHVEHVEANYSFRTRILDYMWASLPVIATGGDNFSDVISRNGIGTVVPSEDAAAVAEALRTLLDDPDERRAISGRSAAVARQFVWSEVLRPLVAFCNNPRRAPDVGSLLPYPPVPRTGPPAPVEARELTTAMRLANAFDRGGARALAQAALRSGRRRLAGWRRSGT